MGGPLYQGARPVRKSPVRVCLRKDLSGGQESADRAEGGQPGYIIKYESGEKATLARYCEEWLTISRNRVKPSTYAKYRNIILHYIIPHIGPRYPQELTTLLMEQYVELLLREGSVRSDKGLSPKTVHDTLCVLRSVFSYIRKQPGSLMPEIEIIPPRCQKRQIRVLTMAQQEQLIHYLRKDTDDCKFGVLLALLTGMRIGEVCALQWQDISLPDRVVHMRATMQRLQVQNAERKTAICISAPKVKMQCEISRYLRWRYSCAPDSCNRTRRPIF